MSEMKNMGSLLPKSPESPLLKENIHPSVVGMGPDPVLEEARRMEREAEEKRRNNGEDTPEVALKKEEAKKIEREREERMNATEGYFKEFIDEKEGELNGGRMSKRRMNVLQNDFDGETKKITEIKSSIAEKKSVEELREEVERLKESYYLECERQIEYRKKKSGILERIKTWFFLPKDKSSSEQLNTIFLDEQVKKSRSAYIDAKRELEKYEGVEKEV